MLTATCLCRFWSVDVKRLLSFLFLVILGNAYATDKYLVVIIPSYNNAQWYQRNLDMLLAQNMHFCNWHALYIDDCSSDGTADLVAAYIEQHQAQNKIFLQRNHQRMGALANLYYATHDCPDEVIIVTYDGDDWFKDEFVLAYINQVYQNPDVWLTYGQYEEYPSGARGICLPFPDWVHEQHAYRDVTWVSSHLRTFYAWLFKHIKKEDLLWEGEFFPMTWDLAIMFPMLEMAKEHAHYLDRILYVYNIQNPLNDFKKDLNLMYKLHWYIRGKNKYEAYSRTC